MLGYFLLLCLVASYLGDSAIGDTAVPDGEMTIYQLEQKNVEIETKLRALMDEVEMLRDINKKNGNAERRIRREKQDVVPVINVACNREETVTTSTSKTGGSVYVRWGHTGCPSNSVLVYTGVAAGAGTGLNGNGANQLCLLPNPEFDSPVKERGRFRAFIKTIQYEINDFPLLNNREKHAVTCAVCRAPARTVQLMVPGRNTCPTDDDWTLEYGGFLMAERDQNAHYRSMFICVDRAMEKRADTGADAAAGRAKLSLVESVCSSRDVAAGLPCGSGGYVDGYELTCAVCTR